MPRRLVFQPEHVFKLNTRVLVYLNERRFFENSLLLMVRVFSAIDPLLGDEIWMSI